MVDRHEVLRKHAVADAKTAEAIAAIEAGDKGWQDVARAAMPAMSDFTAAVRDYALGELRRLNEEEAERLRLAARPWWKKVLRLGR